MATTSFNPRLSYDNNNHKHGAVVDEIQGLIRVYKDGCVERPPIVPVVSCAQTQYSNATAKDVRITHDTWARIYLPGCGNASKLPLLVYFHGGGFCVGSAAWRCYHEFLMNLMAMANCVVVSVNYRLAPENRLPAAYDDGFNAILWIKQQAASIACSSHTWWLSKCDFSRTFLAGDSAGGNIALQVAKRVSATVGVAMAPAAINLKGLILIQPFFGGESRTRSEKDLATASTVLSLSASDTYWRLALPRGATRDHAWCNPHRERWRDTRLSPVMVCVSEMDILRDRDLELCDALRREGKLVEIVMCRGVGHAFQILGSCETSGVRRREMMQHLKRFINLH